MSWFDQYREDFEKAVVLGVRQGLLGKKKAVPVSAGKLAKRKIGAILGDQVRSEEIIVLDYYGYMKKSQGFQAMVREVIASLKGKQLKMVEAPVVHFNSIRLEILAKIAPDLVTKFAEFKKAVLDAREFNHNYKA
jgi:hypothetical protein